jgi:hypothetical protein
MRTWCYRAQLTILDIAIATRARINDVLAGDLGGIRRRFAEAVRDRKLVGRAAAVGQALRTSRIVHRAVGRWLSVQVTGAQLLGDDALIDPELGVHVADLLEAVSVHEVADVGTRLMSAPAAAVGVLLDPEATAAVAAEACTLRQDPSDSARSRVIAVA